MSNGQTPTTNESIATPTLITNLDATRWNDIVLQHDGHLLQSWVWGELKGQFGWQPRHIAVTNGRQTAAAQLLIRRFFGVAAAYVPRGPVWSGDEQLDRYLIETLRRTAQRERAAFLRIEPNALEHHSMASRIALLLHTNRFRIAEPLQPRSSIHLDLTPGPDKLFAAFTKGHRADVRRAERNGVQVRVGSSKNDLLTFYSIMETTGARQQFGIHAQAYYAAALQHFGDAARMLIAEHEGEAVAAFLIFGRGREAQYMYSGSNEQGLKLGANHLLQWHALQWAHERGCTIYDFWGIPDAFGQMAHATGQQLALLEAAAKTHPLYGVYRFKKGWGGNVVRYLPAYDQVYFAPAYWVWQRRRDGDG
jgi:lipid II:glycine glycyltransferase (peptidoglycan interpeptide bridge formation enzyme)